LVSAETIRLWKFWIGIPQTKLHENGAVRR